MRSTRQQKPEPWGTSQPHNAYIESDYLTRIVVGHENRLQSKQITSTSVFHQSLEFSPQKLVSPDYMVTTSIIQKEFGSGFHPDYPALNEFEAYCKNNWNKEPVCDAELFALILSLITLGSWATGDLLSSTTRTLSSGLRCKSKAMVIVSKCLVLVELGLIALSCRYVVWAPQSSHKACVFLKCVQKFDSVKGFSWNMVNL